MPTLLSLFDGSGGFPLAGSLCGITPVAASEVEPYPIAVTKSRFPNMKHLGDISKINGAEIEPVDIITFGSPCQDLSVAGKRAGLKHSNHGDDETTRSGLFMEAVRIIKEMRLKTNGKYPRFAVWENVPGAFSSNKGEDFRIVLEEIIKVVEPSAVMPEVPQKGWAYADSYCGDGWSLAYRVLDAQYWGVPQRRRRIYLVADFGGECAREILFERKGLRGYFTQGRTPWKTTTTDVERSVGTDDRERTYGVVTKGNGDAFISSERHTSLATGGGQAGQGYPCVMESAGFCPEQSAKTRGIGYEDEIAPTLRGGVTPGVVCSQAEKNFVDVELEVAVRKYEVDTERLSECLRKHKGKWTNKDIAEALDKPLTLVEHWFRKDKYFAIPDPDVWFDLKKLLGIETTEFDKAVMEFVYDGGNYDMRNRIYTGSISPTLTCESGNALYLLPLAIENHPNDSRVKIDESGKVQALTGRMGTGGGNVPMVMEPKVYEWHNQDSRIKGPIDVGCTLNTNAGGREGHLVLEHANKAPVLTASKASFFMLTEEELASTLVATDYKDPQLVCYCLQGNGIDRVDTAGCNGKGWCEDKSYTLNTIDRPAVAYGLDRASFNQGANAQFGFSVLPEQQPTLTAKGPGAVCHKSPPRYIVRRLTPTECARLQGFADRWGDIDTKTKFSDEEYHFWLDVRNTHASINGRQTKEYTKAQMLTWYNKLLTDSAEYKMWGNGIALPCALYVMQGIEDALQRE